MLRGSWLFIVHPTPGTHAAWLPSFIHTQTLASSGLVKQVWKKQIFKDWNHKHQGGSPNGIGFPSALT